jgi:predicted Zn-dependent peptidase
VFPDQLQSVIDVLFDLVLNPTFDEAAIAAETEVAIEQMAEERDPSRLVYEEFNKDLFGSHPLGRPVLGRAESLRSLAQKNVLDWHRAHYRPSNLILAAAGCAAHEDLIHIATRTLAGLPERPIIDIRARPRWTLRTPRTVRVVPDKRPGGLHIVLGAFGLPQYDERRFAAYLINDTLGSGRTSRLWRAMRLKRSALVQARSYSTSYEDTGSFNLYIYTPMDELDEVLALCVGELDKVIYRGLGDEELRIAKNRAKYALDLDRSLPETRAQQIGKAEALNGAHTSFTEAAAKLDAVSSADIRSVAADLFGGPKTMVMVGQDPGRDFSAIIA